MLSRIAESLYWVGRYVERADGTARIVDQVRLAMLEDRAGSVEAGRRVLSVLLAQVPEADVTYHEVARTLVFDQGNPSSLGGSWYAARENARRAREVLPIEVWEVLNGGWVRWQRMPALDATARPLAWIRARAAMFHGVVDSTMSHDDAWLFLRLGSSLERADMSARIIAAGTQQNQVLGWAQVLASAGGQQGYLRGQRGVLDDRRVAAFLMLDRQFPRSVVYSLARAENCLERLDPEPPRVGVRDDAKRLLGRMRSALEYDDLETLYAALPSQLLAVQETVRRTGDAVARRYFPSGAAPVWNGEIR